jgi:hypothetical protein
MLAFPNERGKTSLLKLLKEVLKGRNQVDEGCRKKSYLHRSKATMRYHDRCDRDIKQPPAESVMS